MNALKTLVITDLTRMGGPNICIAGYEVDGESADPLECLRPVFGYGHPTEGWLRMPQGNVIRPFSRIEFSALERAPDPPHTEDLFIDPVYRQHRGFLNADQRRAFLDKTRRGSVCKIFGAEICREHGSWVRYGEGKCSLGTIQARIDKVIYGPNPYQPHKLDYRLQFRDSDGERFRLPVTDLSFRYSLDFLGAKSGIEPSRVAESFEGQLHRSDVYLRIGLARHWQEYPDRCYLQVNGVYSFPDYLGGRCFADIALTPGELSEYRARVLPS